MKTQEEIEQLAEQYVWGRVYLTEQEKQQTEIAYMSGYTQCQEDMVDNSINFAEWLVNKYFMIHDKKWNNKNNEYDESDYTTKELYDIFINSLNKQD